MHHHLILRSTLRCLSNIDPVQKASTINRTFLNCAASSACDRGTSFPAPSVTFPYPNQEMRGGCQSTSKARSRGTQQRGDAHLHLIQPQLKKKGLEGKLHFHCGHVIRKRGKILISNIKNKTSYLSGEEIPNSSISSYFITVFIRGVFCLF